MERGRGEEEEMQIKSAEFLLSSPSVSKCPDLNSKEFAFIGRSNVGKSSLINMLTGNSSLAKTSGTPGKTQLINYFSINKGQIYFVDLPGYGYARISKTEREKWEKMINNYLLKRENLHCIFVLIDSRIAAQKIDIEFVNWLGEKGLPFILVFTKADKKVKSQENAIASFTRELLKTWEEIPPIILTSATTKLGKDEILDIVAEAI
jgi:GTP-binding protein